MDRETYRAIVVDVLAAEQAEVERTGDENDSEPRPPATEADVAAAEHALGATLHPSYREFLLAHDGWEHFEWGLSLFGTAELSGDHYRSALETRSYDDEDDNPHTYHSAACLLVKAGQLDRAVDCLRRARAAGYPHMDRVETDDDLEAIRDRPDFRALFEGDEEE